MYVLGMQRLRGSWCVRWYSSCGAAAVDYIGGCRRIFFGRLRSSRKSDRRAPVGVGGRALCFAEAVLDKGYSLILVPMREVDGGVHLGCKLLRVKRRQLALSGLASIEGWLWWWAQVSGLDASGSRRGLLELSGALHREGLEEPTLRETCRLVFCFDGAAFS